MAILGFEFAWGTTTSSLVSGLSTQCAMCVLSHLVSHVQLFVTPRTIAHQAPLPLKFSGKNTEVGSYSLL